MSLRSWMRLDNGRFAACAARVCGVVHEARGPNLGWSRLIVAAGWLTVALSLLLHVSSTRVFKPLPDSGIKGWITVNAYPKQQEFFFFTAAVCGIPAVLLIGWIVWLLLAGVLSLVLKSPVRTVLRQTAVPHLLLLAPWPQLMRMDPAAGQAIWKPLAWAGIPALCLVAAWNLWRARKGRPKDNVLACLPPDGCQTSAQVVTRAPGCRAVSWVTHLLVPVLLYAVAYDRNMDGGFCYFHDAERLVPMDEMMRGAMPYRDIYLQHGLFANALIPRLAAALFEPSLAGLRTLEHFLAPLSLVAAYFLVFMTFRFRLVSGLLVSVVLLAARTSAGNFVGLLGLAMLASAIRRPAVFALLERDVFASTELPHDTPGWRRYLFVGFRKGWRLLAAGFLAMLAFWWHVDVGLYVLGTGALFTLLAGLFQGRGVPWRARALPLLCFGVGALAGFLVVGWYFIVHGAMKDLCWNVWVQCRYQLETWGVAYPRFADTFRPMLIGPNRPGLLAFMTGYSMSFYVGPLAVTLAAVALACRAAAVGFWNSRWAPQLLLLTLAGTLYLRRCLGRSDGAHMDNGIFFSTVLALFAVSALAGWTWDIVTDSTRQLRSRAICGGFALFLAVAAGWAMSAYVTARWKPVKNLVTQWNQTLQPVSVSDLFAEPVPRMGILDLKTGNQAGEIRKVIAYIRSHTRKDERVFDFSNQALWLYLAGRRPASRYFLSAYASLPALQREVIADIERHQVNLVIYSTGSWFDRIDRLPQEVRLPILADYLKRNFKPADRVGKVSFWRRAAEPAGKP